ncbi:MAG: peptide chain release factor N(5)-glutamine methyltransferase [Thermoguttaceae bacterium]
MTAFIRICLLFIIHHSSFLIPPMPPPEPWSVGRLLQWTADYLKGHGSESPRLDAEVLLAEVLGCQRIQLYATFEDVPNEQQRAAFRQLVRRRAEGTPVAYLVGRREFYSLSFRVTPDVLIPRPETELLVVAVLDLGKEGSGVRGQGSGAANQQSAVSNQQSVISIADVGAGSGVIAVCLAKHLPASRVTAIDISPAALAVAADNARQHGVADRIEFVESDLFAAVAADRKFDFIVSNPPYVSTAEFQNLAADVRNFEPQSALLAGPKGTEVIERLIPQAAGRLRPGGHFLIEISPMIHDAVCSLLKSEPRFQLGPTIKDIARLPRVVQARKRI